MIHARTGKRFLLVLAILLSAVALAGCGAATQKSEFAGPDWSRGILLGEAAINNRPSLILDPQSGDAMAVWLAQQDGVWRFEYRRVDGQGQVVSATALPLSLRYPTYARLVRDDGGGIHLFWRDTATSGLQEVYRARISSQGEVLSEPQRLSGQTDAGNYAVVEAVRGGLDVFWSDTSGANPVLYHARYGDSGEEIVSPHSLDVWASGPSCALDSDGLIHLAWHWRDAHRGEHVYYGTFDPETLQLSEPLRLASATSGTGAAFHAPEIGLDATHVYVFWSQELRKGGFFDAGNAWSYYHTFPIGHPEARTGDTFHVPGSFDPGYVSATGSLNYQSLAYLAQAPEVSGIAKEQKQKLRSSVHRWHKWDPEVWIVDKEYTYLPNVIPGQRDELTVVLSVFVAEPQRSMDGWVQIAMAVMDEGQWKGYQLAGATRSTSMRPVAVASEKGEIHLAWIDAGGFGRYEVFYASTAPTVQDTLNRITLADVVAEIAGGAWSATAALSFFPVVLLWVLIPLTWMVVFAVIRPDSDLRTRAGKVAVGVALLLYLLSKFFLFPAFLSYAPFLGIVAPQFQGLIYLGLPLLLAGLGLLALRTYARRSQRQVTLIAFGLFVLVDAILSLVLYMPGAIAV